MGETLDMAVDDPDYAHTIIDLNYDAGTALGDAIQAICDQAVAAVKNGTTVLVLSDRDIEQGKLPIQALLATGAVHHRLTRENLRCDANLVIDTASARDAWWQFPVHVDEAGFRFAGTSAPAAWADVPASTSTSPCARFS